MVIDAERAGKSLVTIIASDFDDRIASITKRGLTPSKDETYENGMRKTTYADTDGNQIAFGGGQSQAT